MDRKTEERLDKRWLHKPLHLVDTSVILEILIPKNTETRRDCERYVSRLGNFYRGALSTLILGEFAEAALQTDRPELLLEFLPRFIKASQVDVAPVGSKAVRAAEELCAAESRLEHYDSLHLATASQEGCSAFVTLETKIIHNRELEQKLKLKIAHPKELI